MQTKEQQIDYSVAQQFGLTVPEGLLKQADEITARRMIFGS